MWERPGWCGAGCSAVTALRTRRAKRAAGLWGGAVSPDDERCWSSCWCSLSRWASEEEVYRMDTLRLELWSSAELGMDDPLVDAPLQCASTAAPTITAACAMVRGL